MPQFIPAHATAQLAQRHKLDAFTLAYLTAIEWTLPEAYDHEGNATGPARAGNGFTRAAINLAKQDCADFQAANQADLAAAYAAGRYSEESAGIDFWLTRERHGAGFWDRGLGELGNRLTAAAHAYGDGNCEVWRGWIHLR